MNEVLGSPEMPKLPIIAASADINIPKYEGNKSQDCTLADDALGIYAIADGVGGNEGGEWASNLACFAFNEYVRENYHTLSNPETADDDIKMVLKNGIDVAIVGAFVSAVEDKQNPMPLEAATTFTAMVRLPNSRVGVIHAGDSAAFLQRDGYPLRKLTEEQAVGSDVYNAIILQKNRSRSPMDLEDEVFIETIQPGDKILLCSDGLLGDNEDQRTPHKYIEEVLRSARTPEEATIRLSRLPEDLQHENITVETIEGENVSYQAKIDDRGIVTVFFSSPTQLEANLPEADGDPKNINEIIAERPEYEQSFLTKFYEMARSSERSAAVFEAVTITDPDAAAEKIAEYQRKNIKAKDLVGSLKESMQKRKTPANVAVLKRVKKALQTGKTTPKTKEWDFTILETAYSFIVESYVPADFSEDEAHDLIKTRLNTIRAILHYNGEE